MKKIQILTDSDFKRNANLISQARLQYVGKGLLLTIEPIKKKRSNNQNSFYWGVVIPIVQNGLLDATGELRSAENIHYNILQKMFAPEREIANVDTGQFFHEKISSSEMTTTQFMEYVMEIQKWAAEFLGIDIPNPNEEMMLSF